MNAYQFEGRGRWLSDFGPVFAESVRAFASPDFKVGLRPVSHLLSRTDLCRRKDSAIEYDLQSGVLNLFLNGHHAYSFDSSQSEYLEYAAINEKSLCILDATRWGPEYCRLMENEIPLAEIRNLSGVAFVNASELIIVRSGSVASFSISFSANNSGVDVNISLPTHSRKFFSAKTRRIAEGRLKRLPALVADELFSLHRYVSAFHSLLDTCTEDGFEQRVSSVFHNELGFCSFPSLDGYSSEIMLHELLVLGDLLARERCPWRFLRKPERRV